MGNLTVSREYSKGDYVIYTDSNKMKYRAVVESVGSGGYTLTVSTSKKRTVGMVTMTVLANASALEPMTLTIIPEFLLNSLVSVE